MNGLVTALMGHTRSEAALQFRLRMFTALSFILSLALGMAFYVLYSQFHVVRQQKEVEIIAANQGAALREQLNHCLAATYALAAILRESDGAIRNFDVLAAEMIQMYGGIDSLQLAKDGVVSHVVPISGNAQIIGHDLLKDPERNKEALHAIRTRRLTLAGPLDLRQGGRAIIGRLPVFLHGENGNEQFWGFATAVISVPELIGLSGLRELARSGYDYELVHVRSDADERQIFARTGNAALDDPVITTIDVPNGKWILNLAPADGWWEPALSWLAAAAVLLASVLVSLFTHATFKQPLLLRREVAERTQDLAQANRTLTNEIAERERTEENLRKLSRAVEQSANAVVITDREGIIEYVNPWFTRITGYTPQEVLGKTPRVLKSGETHPETYKRLWETITTGKEWTGELHNTKKNGELYWCLEVISPLKDDDGNITHFVAVTEDISERKQTEQTIRHLAFHDPLTGLPNRRLFNDRLQQATARRHRKDNAFALMLLDLDRFKTVNDTLGHDIGDALLKAVAARLLGCTREGDTLARMGGDEFALIALEVGQPEDMARMAKKLIDVLKEPFVLSGHELYVTTSMGVTLYPNDATDADALVKNADIALYRAKDLGRNNFQFFTGDMNAAMMQRLRLESAMRGASERNEFMLQYQPQVDATSGVIHGTEALIRWRHPEYGMISPGQFIPLAEETGMIVQIGEWILRTACTQAKAWQQAGRPMRVAVNLSARQFHQGDLAETVAHILKELDLPAELLEVELTEGILMEDTAQTTAVLVKLHEMGVQISIDDFGTGYSSLSYLKRLPIQILKIDQTFVRDIHTDSDDRAIVTAVIALAHSMKLKVVAEGVETPEQQAFLKEHACDMMQGYLFSRPVSGDEVLALMASGVPLPA